MFENVDLIVSMIDDLVRETATFKVPLIAYLA